MSRNAVNSARGQDVTSAVPSVSMTAQVIQFLSGLPQIRRHFPYDVRKCRVETARCIAATGCGSKCFRDETPKILAAPCPEYMHRTLRVSADVERLVLFSFLDLARRCYWRNVPRMSEDGADAMLFDRITEMNNGLDRFSCTSQGSFHAYLREKRTTPPI